MKNLNQFAGQVCLSINEMRSTRGGEKQLIECTLRSDEQGSYWHMVYSDGSVEDVACNWIC